MLCVEILDEEAPLEESTSKLLFPPLDLFLADKTLDHIHIYVKIISPDISTAEISNT